MIFEVHLIQNENEVYTRTKICAERGSTERVASDCFQIFLGLTVKSKTPLGKTGVEGDPTDDSNWVEHFDCKARPTGREKLLFVMGFPSRWLR